LKGRLDTLHRSGYKLRRNPGKFWPQVRALIWQKAQELFQQDQAKTMRDDFSGVTAERTELVEGGYFYIAKLRVLRDLWLRKKGLPTVEEEEYGHLQA
jgi:hypothetical protein